MDSMKRSVNNQLTAQGAKATILGHLFFLPIFTWRFFDGPINPMLSTFASAVDNVYKSWLGLCFTQMAIFKVKKLRHSMIESTVSFNINCTEAIL